MATASNITRRRLIQALPFIGAAAMAPMVTQAGEAEHIDLSRPAPTGNPYTMETFALGRFGVLATKHREAEAVYIASADSGDEQAIDRAFAATEAALMAICSYVPCSRHDEQARAQYLLEFTEPNMRFGPDLERHHVIALLGSMGRYELTTKI